MSNKFSDLMDIDKLQALFDNIYKVTGIAAGVADIDGTALTKTGWTNLCTKFHRINPQALRRCIETEDRSPELAKKAINSNDAYIYYECKNGITHAIAPIVIQGNTVALIYKSQFLLTPPDLEYFREQAKTLGLPENEYIEVVKELPVYTKEEVDKFMEFASYIANLFGEMGRRKLMLSEEQVKSDFRYQELTAKHRELMAAYEELADMEQELHNRKHKIRYQEGALKESEDRIRYLAYHDTVTGLPNRTKVTDYITYCLCIAKRDNKKGAILFLDIDNFKVINDTFGHEFGDKVLKRLGVELERIIGTEGIVGRFGGDEFIVAKCGIEDEKDVKGIVNSILETLSYPWIIDGYDVFPTISVGIAIFPDDGNKAETLIKNADIAMYEAKSYGKNTYEFFESTMNDKVIQRMAMEMDLRNALERDEFNLVYQPQVNSKTGRIETVEALIRWNHPEYGIISPGQFIPFAEDTGIIVPIGEWVLHTACRQNRQWQDKGYDPVRVSVNISPLQLRRWNFISLVQEVLEEVRLDPSYLELEITESNLMESLEENIKGLERLKQMGVRIALDDFGTGYSSLNYLQRLPINNMKIDKSFVEDITNDHDKRYIAEVIIALAHRMNLKVTAEGVETEEQLSILISKNCDIIQGYLFSKPLPSHEIEGLLKRGRLDLREVLAGAIIE